MNIARAVVAVGQAWLQHNIHYTGLKMRSSSTFLLLSSISTKTKLKIWVCGKENDKHNTDQM
jgi:hypothetical protein